jgi:hypothetical protein
VIVNELNEVSRHDDKYRRLRTKIPKEKKYWKDVCNE